MAIGRGENVGTAYVKIIGDGSSLPNDIEDEFDDIDFDRHGREAGQDWSRGVQRGIERERPKTQERLDGMFRVHASRMRQLANEITTPLFRNLEENIRRQHPGRLGERIVTDIRRGFVQGGGWQQWGDHLQGLFDEIQRSAERHTQKLIAEDNKQTNVRLRNFFRTSNAVKIASDQMAANHTRSMGRLWEGWRKLDVEMHGNVRTIDDVGRGWRRAEGILVASTIAVDRLTPRIGRAFGKGSRNDLLNFFGGLMEGGTRMLNFFPKAIAQVSEFGRTFYTAIRAGEGLKGAFTAAAGGAGRLGSVFASAASAAGAFAIAIPVIVVVLGTLIAAVSMLAGVLVAVLASAFYAAVAAVGALAGAILPAVAAVGVLAGAIMSMDDEMKASLKNAIRPLVDEMRELGQVAAKEIFRDAPEQAARMGKALQGLRPLVAGVGRAIRNVGNYWVDALESPAFKAFKREMTDFLPGAVESLGKSFGNFIGGMAGLFRGLLPITERFLGWLERITSEFADWANSAKGQNEIKDFMDDAAESAIVLKDFLKEVGGLIMDLFMGGKDTGDGIFEGLTDAVARFREYISDGSLEKWFEDTAEFAGNLGEALEGVAKAIDIMDNDFTRFAAKGILTTLAGTFWLLDAAMWAVTQAVKPFVNAFELGVTAATWLWDKVSEGAQWAWEKLQEFWGWLTDVFSTVWTVISEGAGLAWSIISTGAQFVWDALVTLWTWLVETFAPVWMVISTAAQTAWTIISTGVQFVWTALTTLWAWLVEIFTPVWAVISATAQTAWTIISTAVQVVWSALQTLWGWLVSVFGPVWTVVSSVASTALSVISTAVQNMWSALQSVAGWITTGFTVAWTTLQTVATTVINTIKTAFSTGFNAIKTVGTTAMNAVRTAIDWVTQKLAPLRTAAQWVIDKLQGIARVSFGPVLAGLGMVKWALDGAKSAGQWAMDKIRSLARIGMGPLVGAINAVKGAIDAVKSAAESAIGAVGRLKNAASSGIGFSPGIGLLGLLSARGSIIEDGFMMQAKPRMAAGGFLNYQQNYRGVTAGEAGREAIVPLDRPLGQIDPAVRAIAAFAQGKLTGNTGKSIHFGDLTVVTPSRDPRAVAKETVDEIAGRIL